MIWWNAALLLAGHIPAIGYFRSRSPWLGLLLLVGLWSAVDAALVMRFGLGLPESAWRPALLAMQILACGSTARFLFLRVRRKNKRYLAFRERSFREGLAAFIRDDLVSARSSFRVLTRRDPWDLEAKEAFAMARSARPLATAGGSGSSRTSPRSAAGA